MALNANDSLIRSIDIDAKEWETKEWQGLSIQSAYNIWTDGENIYYSSGTGHYQLNKATSTWETKTWSGLTSFDGRHIWTDGENIYYSSGSTQYYLNQALATPTWQTKTWSGLTKFDSYNIWSDGANIYYSNGTKEQYQLNKATSTWETKTWSGLTNLVGAYIWSDDSNIYYSRSTDHYQLNKATSTWETKTWSGFINAAGNTSFYGNDIWKDNGGTVYFSQSSIQYELTPSIHYAYKDDTCEWVKPYTIKVKIKGSTNPLLDVIIFRSSNAKAQEPSATYDTSGGEDSYIINISSDTANDKELTGYYGDTLYVKAQTYSYTTGQRKYTYSIYSQSYTVTGDGVITITCNYSYACTTCSNSSRKISCNIVCSTNLATACEITSSSSSRCSV